MINITDFRNGMSLLGGAVSIITTHGENGKCGITASAVCSVTDNPPTLLVCVNRNSWSHAHFVSNKAFCVNVLAAGHESLSGRFADKNVTMDERFTTHKWLQLETGAPALEEAVVNFDCQISDSHNVGTHTVFFGVIKSIRFGGSRSGLMYFNRNYHHLPENPASSIA